MQFRCEYIVAVEEQRTVFPDAVFDDPLSQGGTPQL